MKGTTYAAMGSEKGGPSVAMGDHIRRHGWSQGDQVFCHRRSGGTNRSAAHGPGGPILGGTNYRVTGPLQRQQRGDGVLII